MPAAAAYAKVKGMVCVMSHLASSFAASRGTSTGPTACETIVRERWPNLADCLYGVTSAESGSPSLPPCSIILAAEGQGLRFVLCPLNQPQRGYGSISDCAKGLDGLEDELARGAVQWSTPRNKRSR